MKNIKVNIKLFSYDELKGIGKSKAYEKHFDFLCSVGDLTEEDKEFIEDSLRINEYLFFENGEIANITHYTDGHKKAGITEFKFQGEVYILDKGVKK